jgi:hypothetical protein
MPGVYDLVFTNDLRWPYLKLDGGKTLTLDPVEVRVNRPWNAHACCTRASRSPTSTP